jgi:hypothetical protein
MCVCARREAKMVVSRSTSSGSCHAPFPPSPPSAAAASDAAYAAAPCCNSDRRPAVACVSRLPHPHNKSSSIALALAPSINCPLTTDRRRLLHFAVGASGHRTFAMPRMRTSSPIRSWAALTSSRGTLTDAGRNEVMARRVSSNGACRKGVGRTLRAEEPDDGAPCKCGRPSWSKLCALRG